MAISAINVINHGVITSSKALEPVESVITILANMNAHLGALSTAALGSKSGLPNNQTLRSTTVATTRLINPIFRYSRPQI